MSVYSNYSDNCNGRSGLSHFVHLPICKRQPAGERVAIKAFHVLTLGIPLALGMIALTCLQFCKETYHYLGYRRTINKLLEEDLKPVERKALNFALKVLMPNPFSPRWLCINSETLHPMDPKWDQVPLLTRLHFSDRYFFHQLETVGKNYKDKKTDFWKDKNAVQIATEAMYIDYALNTLTLF